MALPRTVAYQPNSAISARPASAAVMVAGLPNPLRDGGLDAAGDEGEGGLAFTTGSGA